MADFTIRPFRPDDGEALADLHRRAIMATPDDDYTPEQKQGWVHGIRPELYAPKGGSVMDVAVAPNGRPIAFCHYKDDEILGLYVDPNWQKRGVGRDLLARAEQAIATSGHASIRITGTVSALNFYVANGYRVLERGMHTARNGMLLPCLKLEKAIVTSR
jgi:GNAT superfamily N-acetyltransferase